MIEINLVPAKIQKAKGMQQWYSLMGLGGAVVFAIIGFLFFTAQRDSSRIAKEIESVKAEQEKLRPIITKIERIRSEEQLKTDKLAQIKTLLDKQVFWLRVAQDLNDALPGGVWYSVVRSIGPPGKLAGLGLQLEGAATSKAAIGELIANLAQKSTFAAISVTRADDGPLNGYNVVRFVVTLSVTAAG